jgi:hypothetical protein
VVTGVEVLVERPDQRPRRHQVRIEPPDGTCPDSEVAEAPEAVDDVAPREPGPRHCGAGPGVQSEYAGKGRVGKWLFDVCDPRGVPDEHRRMRAERERAWRFCLVQGPDLLQVRSVRRHERVVTARIQCHEQDRRRMNCHTAPWHRRATDDASMTISAGFPVRTAHRGQPETFRALQACSGSTSHLPW